MEEEVMQLRKENSELRKENSELRKEIEQLKKDKYLMRMQNDMNAAENNHLEKILREVKDTLSYL